MSTYNGHESWAHWNVSLWIFNDECLYNLVEEVVRGYPSGDTTAMADEVLDVLNSLDVQETPDGAEYTVDTLIPVVEDML